VRLQTGEEGNPIKQDTNDITAENGTVVGQDLRCVAACLRAREASAHAA